MIKRLAAILLASTAGLAHADVQGWTVTVSPALPTSLQPVYARIAVNQTCLLDPTQTRARQEGNSIVLSVKDVGGSCIPTGGDTIQDVSLGQFHPGQFSVIVRFVDGAQLTSTQFAVAEGSRTGPLIDYSDLWWNPQESGWGMGLTHHASGLLFATWYTYDDNSSPLWLTLQPGRWTSIRTYSGPIYLTSGPSYSGAFDPSRFSVRQVGTGTLTFESPSSALFEYTVNGRSATRRIERMIF